MDLTATHIERLHALVADGFEMVSFPFFPNTVGVKKYGCGALLQPVADGRWRLAAQPGRLIEGNISVVVERGGGKWFVWKSYQERATPDLLDTLRRFEEELRERLESPAAV